ncbi:MAG: hypothetical protein OXG39_07850 [Chloroflexi bacterium]|nr:hypothetical protein [Chloroflexota bacterium]
MITRLSRSSRFSPVPVLLALNIVLLVLLALLILAMPAPGIQTGFGGATVDIRADRAWVLFPRQCVNITWQLEGIKSLTIDGHGKVGADEMTFCPSTDVTSPNFEVTAANGEARTYFLNIRYLPAATVSSLTLLALTLPFIIACYYFATMRLLESSISDLSPLLALSALLLVCLLMRTVLRFTIDDVLNGLGNLFTSQSWYLFGWVMAGLVFIPLAIQSLWHRWRSGFREDFIVIGAFFALILLLYLPFGFDFVWQYEEWVYQAFLEGRASRAESEVTSRFWLLMLYPLANVSEVNPIIFHHHLHVFLATSKLVLLYGIVRKFGVAPLYAFLFTMLSMVYPVNALLMSSRSVLYAFSMSALFAAVYLTLLFMEKPSRLRLLGILLALLFNVGSYENAYMIIVIAPILWFWRSPRWTSHNFNLTVIWYLMPAAKLIYMFILANAGRRFYGDWQLSNATEQGRPLLEAISHYQGVLANVYLHTFTRGWQEAFNSLSQNAWLASTLAALLLTAGVAVYLARHSKGACFPSRRKLSQSTLAGLFFILAAIAALIWFETYQTEAFRIYIYVPFGAAAVVMSLLLLVVSPIKNRRLRQAALVCLCLMLMFPAASRLFVQQASLVKGANAIAKVLSQIVRQAPHFDDNARLIIVIDISNAAFDENGISEFWSNMLDSAIYLLYQEGRPSVSLLCRLQDRCSKDDLSKKMHNIEQVTDFSRIVLFRLKDDLNVDLLRQLPTELDGALNHTYNPERLIDTSAPIPARARILLGDRLPVASEETRD